MKCTVLSSIVFVVAAILYGASYAFVAKGLKYFSAGLFQTFRMLFGFIFTVGLLIVRYIINKDGVYRQIVKAHFTSGVMPIVWMLIDGLLNLGTPHCLIAVAQKWVSSADVQLMLPISTGAGAILAHFVLSDEPFTWWKLWSILASIAGVALCGVPSFRHAESTGASIKQMCLGYFLVFISVIMFGIAPVFYKWKCPNSDVTTGVAIQLFASVLWNAIWMLCFDGPKNITQMVNDAPPIAWLWPVMVGVLVSGVAVQCLLYLVTALGSFGTNLVPFGQLITGVIVGVAFLHEWDAYKKWEIGICCVGILFIILSLAFGFVQPKAKNNEEEEEKGETEHRNEEEDENDEQLAEL
ncbi:Integral membrane protein, putative [Trichomonas vaginalis G3]|uniref:Integral membrane protein, putative n=1 Tax=Trichomonas vaginalis (strain ATCC PRA-98 / G3) TaxID=412133 RepID=A2FDB6_TRIV3|nr:EamA-like transporter family [Trichomonas vaginalis G3]EAX97118.1 Integral membrane protein, putative [Trichomonas vaginalis G3]KAI5513008.1 EamA-like transporter family [Trichomonas vaginalis G3]|eukprot:XP_001310048.1 Integral membrane protein [Trichomonas vaginalis G3]